MAAFRCPARYSAFWQPHHHHNHHSPRGRGPHATPANSSRGTLGQSFVKQQQQPQAKKSSVRLTNRQWPVDKGSSCQKSHPARPSARVQTLFFLLPLLPPQKTGHILLLLPPSQHHQALHLAIIFRPCVISLLGTRHACRPRANGQFFCPTSRGAPAALLPVDSCSATTGPSTSSATRRPAAASGPTERTFRLPSSLDTTNQTDTNDDTMSDDGPRLIRPVPRRPFTLRRQSATPTTDDDEELSTPGGSAAAPIGTTSSPGLHNHLTAALAAWSRSGDASSEQASSPAISRPASIMNLTASTLYGIYSPTTAGGARDDVEDSPWGLGAQTPIRRPDIDEPTFALMRERSHPSRRRSSYKGAEMPRGGGIPPRMSSAQVAARTAVLFVLGLGYGALVTRLHDQDQVRGGSTADGPVEPGFNSTYLGAWGVAGVVLGSLLPWFDGVWEDRFGTSAANEDCAVADGDNAPSKAVDTGLDSALVMRAIGAFVGIVFAIRKLAWDSTLQISATLALANPLLWWLIDRSKPGFLLSAAVGLVGSLLLLGISPDMMPTPSLQILRDAGVVNGTAEGSATAPGGAVAADSQIIETGVWMLSVLFCSCLCFGNIGRRLFLSRTTGGQGRWGGVR